MHGACPPFGRDTSVLQRLRIPDDSSLPLALRTRGAKPDSVRYERGIDWTDDE